MRALDGIEPEDDDNDYGVEDIAEDDSLIGYMPCATVLNPTVLRRYPRGTAQYMDSLMYAGSTIPVGGQPYVGRYYRNNPSVLTAQGRDIPALVPMLTTSYRIEETWCCSGTGTISKGYVEHIMGLKLGKVCRVDRGGSKFCKPLTAADAGPRAHN